MKTKRIEVVLHPLEMEHQFPIGKEIIVGGKHYKVLGDYQGAKQSQSTIFASFPSFLAEEVTE